MVGKLRYFIFAAGMVLWVVAGTASADETQLLQVSGKTMGTTYSVKFRLRDGGKAEEQIEAVQQRIDDRLAEINRSMSTYLEDSEISRFNRSRSTEAFSVSDDFRGVASRALELHQLTDGRFDVTVGPLVRFWGFGGGDIPSRVPTKDQVERIQQRIGSDRLSLTEKGIRKDHAELEVDFSAIAKGYAVDEIAKLMREFSDQFMVEIGGEVTTLGQNPESNRPWAIGVELPVPGPLTSGRPLAARVELVDRALATSGDYRNFVLIEDRKFQHTIDPTTGFPVDRGIMSVSVVADDCMSADGLATGMMVLPLERTQALCAERGIAALVIYQNDQGELDWWQSEDFPGEILIDEQSVIRPVIGGLKPQAEQAENPLYLIVGTVIVFGLAIAGMAVGVILSNRQLKGSCGGLSAMSQNGQGEASPCSLCTKPATDCSRRSEAAQTEASESTSAHS